MGKGLKNSYQHLAVSNINLSYKQQSAMNHTKTNKLHVLLKQVGASKSLFYVETLLAG